MSFFAFLRIKIFLLYANVQVLAKCSLFSKGLFSKMIGGQKTTEENLDCFKIPDTSRRDCDIMSAYMISAGGRSAYGGKWRPSPNKPEDQRLWGKPGEIKRTVTSWGEVFLTKIGQDGRAVMERHLSDHKKPWHTPIHMIILFYGTKRQVHLCFRNRLTILMKYLNLKNTKER